MVSFTSRPLYPQGKSPWYPLDRRLGGPQSRSGRGGEKKTPQPLPGLEPPIIQPVAQRYSTETSQPVLNLAQCYEGASGEWRYSSTHSQPRAPDRSEWSPSLRQFALPYEWLASRPGRFAPGFRGLGRLWIGGWVGRRAGLETAMGNKKNRCPALGYGLEDRVLWFDSRRGLGIFLFTTRLQRLWGPPSFLSNG
jgi:hypothetical protein